MTVAEQKKLAQELESNKPVPAWDDVDDLGDVVAEVVIDGKKRKLNFEKATEMYRDCDAEIARLEALKKDLKEPLQAGLLVAGVEKVTAAGCTVQMVHKEGSKKVDAQKLIELGVAPMTVAKATVVGKPTEYVMIRAIKDRD